MMTIHEYEKIYAGDCEHFDELRKFAEASDFLNLSWKYVQAKNYVGVIRLQSGFQIEILPKLQAPDDKLRVLVMEMIGTLKEFKWKKFNAADLSTSKLSLYEIFIRTYLEMVLELMKRGLRSSYVTREDNLRFFKGKLLVNENLRRNIAHRERFFVSFDEYNLNRPEHRLIKSTLLKLRRITQENKSLAGRLLEELDSVEVSTNYRKDFAEISIDRTNQNYKAVIAWTKIFLGGESFTFFTGKARALALLFDMNKLFEVYVAEHVQKIFSGRFTVKTQAQEQFLFDEPQIFGLKPDIILEGDERIILDTKWKFEPTAGDMYQMFAYARRYDTRRIILICPATEDFYRAADFEVKIFGVDLFNMNESVKKLLDAVSGS